jgi:hypothetical protein
MLYSTSKYQFYNEARFRYLNGYWFRLIDASICWATAKADTQFAIFPCCPPKKQCLIFRTTSVAYVQFECETGKRRSKTSKYILDRGSLTNPQGRRILKWGDRKMKTIFSPINSECVNPNLNAARLSSLV